jgi:hypothetical protein
MQRLVRKETSSRRELIGPIAFQLRSQYKLEWLTEPGIWEIKQVKLWTKWTKRIPPQFQDEICPEPDKEIIQRIKNEKKEKLKQLAAKKKKIGQPALIVATETELIMKSV